MKTSEFLSKAALFMLLMVFSLFLISCNDNDDYFEEDDSDIPGVTIPAKQTVFMYMPWAENLYSIFFDNIEYFEYSIEKNKGMDGNALIVFISQNKQTSNLIRIYYHDGECLRDTLKQYDFSTCDYTETEGIAEIIDDVIDAAPAEKYAMAIGCHGTGWTPAGTNIGARAAMMNIKNKQIPQTRFFGTGDGGDPFYQTDITTLAEAIASSGIKMEYILFDACYMSNIETVYELKNVTNYLIASTCEIMSIGMPYAEIGIDLLKNNYKNIVDKFYEYYSNYGNYPCGTISIVDCREATAMAEIMRQINIACPDLPCDVTDIQDLDGYENTIFFDFGDYVSHLYLDQSLIDAFNVQLDKLVPYKSNTETYYSSYTGRQYPINTFSGITISDPSVNRSIANVKTQTNWYMDTHQ